MATIPYNPSDGTASNKPYATRGKPDSARRYYYDKDGTFRYRQFISIQEALETLVTLDDRRGHEPLVINTGGTVVESGADAGYIIGGTNDEYWWKDGYEDNDLVLKVPTIDLSGYYTNSQVDAIISNLAGAGLEFNEENKLIVSLDENRRFVTDAEKLAWNEKQNALGFIPESTENKNVSNGYAGLDIGGLIPSALLPSYVDDVLEFSNLAAFPDIGESGKIYIALDTNKVYRWGGSVYVIITASPGTTDAITEGSVNLYFTGARVLATILTGINTALTGAPVSTDSILAAFGKVSNFITNIATTIRGTVLTGLSVNNSDVVNTDTVISGLSKLQTSKINQNSSQIKAILTGTNGLTGSLSPAPSAYIDAMEINILPANSNTTATTLNLNGLGAKAVTKNGLPLIAGDLVAGQWAKVIFHATSDTFQIYSGGSLLSKLNVGANTGLVGSNTGILVVLPDGTVVRNTNLTYDAITRTVTIGSTANPGKLDIGSNIFEIKVQTNITTGNAFVTFNDNQEKALIFRSTDGKEYMAMRTTDGDEAVILFQKYIFDMGIASPLNNAQGIANSTTAAKTYVTDYLGTPLSIPLVMDGDSMIVYGRFKAMDVTTRLKVLSGSFETVLRRASGAIIVVSTTINRISDPDSLVYLVGAEAAGANAVQLFVQSNSANAYEWKLSDIKYFL